MMPAPKFPQYKTVPTASLIPYARNARDCRMMELDPKYCDVIIQRWQNFTGETATLEATGQPFPHCQP